MKKYYFASIFILISIVAIVISPQRYILSFSNGLTVWATILLPTLFPFLFFTKLLTDFGIINQISKKFTFTSKIFNTPPISAYGFFISIISGYPIGAKVVYDLYSKKLLTQNEAYRMCTFTSNSGPMFIYGSVGIGMLCSKALGGIILASHIIGSIINGIVYRKYCIKNDIVNTKNEKLSNNKNFSLGETMLDSINSILLIGGFVCIFFVIIEITNSLNLLFPISYLLNLITNISPEIFTAIFNGVIEITHGCLDITNLINDKILATILCCGIITFGGIATIFQAYVFLQKANIKLGFFIKQKLTHTLFSLIICIILLFIFII